MANSQSIEEKFKSLERAGTNLGKTKEFKSFNNAVGDLIDGGLQILKNKFMNNTNETTENKVNAIHEERIIESNKGLYVVVVCSAIHWTLGLASAIYFLTLDPWFG